jgi:hypothetical protein
MKTRHWLFWLSVVCLAASPVAPLFFEQWGAVMGFLIGFALLLVSAAAIITPDLE